MRQSHAGLVSAVLYRVRGLVRLAPGSNPGYTFTFGAHDQAILTRSLVADIACRPCCWPTSRVLLLASGPARSLARRACGAGQAGEPD